MKFKHLNLSARAQKIIEFIVLGIILCNITVMVLDSVPEYHSKYGIEFHFLDTLFLVFFCAEYLFRLFLAQRRIKYATSFYGIIDVLAIAPDLILSNVAYNSSFIKILRLFRITRLVKMGRFSKTIHTLGEVIYSVRYELIVTIGISFIVLFFSSAGIYYLENPIQPQSFSSIIDSFWWAVSSLTGVVMEERYPITGLGKIFATIISMVGVGVVAIPTGIISASFVEVMHAEKERRKSK